MVSVRTLGSHWLISLSEKNNSEPCKMDSDLDAYFEVAALALVLFQRSRRSSLHMKKGKHWVQAGVFSYFC